MSVSIANKFLLFLGKLEEGITGFPTADVVKNILFILKDFMIFILLDKEFYWNKIKPRG